MPPRIYFDNQATTPLDPIILEAMLPYFVQDFGNPHSDDHSFGWDASEAIEQSRMQVANLLNAAKHEIIFTSGATESVNLALQGVAKAALQKTTSKERRKIITAMTEHPCVLECCDYLQSIGFEIIKLPVKKDGLLDMEVVSQAIDESTLLVSVMLVNNEIGVIQPLKEIATLCKKAGAIFHSDATQAIGKLPVDVDMLGVDLLSLSGHKFYAPKGIGALYIRKGIEKNMSPLVYGGGQEKSLRAGTLPVPLIVGLGAACAHIIEHLDEDMAHIEELTRKLKTALKAAVPDMLVFGSQTERVAGNLNIGFPSIEGARLVSVLGDRLALSTGSACASASFEPSHVVQALGVPKEVANTAFRVSIGRLNTIAEVDIAVKLLLEGTGRKEWRQIIERKSGGGSPM